MSPRVAAFLTRLYPRSWRNRYGSEFESLLRELPGGVSVVADVVISAAIVRKRAFAFAGLAAAVVVMLMLSHEEESHVAARKGSTAMIALSACKIYSSTAQTRFVSARRCLT
jgi:hypothetical protein